MLIKTESLALKCIPAGKAGFQLTIVTNENVVVESFGPENKKTTELLAPNCLS